MAPVINALEQNAKFDTKICVTGQHREMLDQVLNLFNLTSHYDLNVMEPKQTLNALTAKILLSMKKVLEDFKPDLVLVHGDTATTFAASLAAYYERIDIGHVEAGLRTGDMYSPWPEEINRKLTGSIARLHFAPTDVSKNNLLSEGISSQNICVTGNTVVDALMFIREKINSNFYMKLLEGFIYS